MTRNATATATIDSTSKTSTVPAVTTRTTIVSSIEAEHVVGHRGAEHRARLDRG